MDDIFTKLILTSHTLLDTAHRLQAPASLSIPTTRDNNVEEARRILRWLRNLQHINYDMENWLRLGGLKEQQSKADSLEKLILIYAGQVKIAQLSNPALLNHFTIDHANHAAGGIAFSISLHTLEILPDGSAAIDILDKQLDNILPEWDARQNQSVEQLINAIESGLTHLMNKPLGDRSPVDRLIEVSNNIQNAVRKLYELDTLGEPERIESIELAREILKRLKDLSFSDKPIEAAIDPGTQSEKLAFAQRISEMVGMYKNLLFEAMRINPDVVHDIRVKNANDAAYWCANSINIMAAKEMPASGAALNDISVHLDQVKSGGDFRGASLNKLVHKIEGGVEHAAEEITIHEKKEQKENLEHDLAAQTETQRHRRRHRRHQNSSKESEGAAQKANTAIQHETIVANIKMEAASSNQAMGGLNKLDIAAVKQAGSSLRKSNKQAHDMAKKAEKEAKAVAAAEANKVAPDNKTFAQRERENPNNPNNPKNRPRIG